MDEIEVVNPVSGQRLRVPRQRINDFVGPGLGWQVATGPDTRGSGGGTNRAMNDSGSGGGNSLAPNAGGGSRPSSGNPNPGIASPGNNNTAYPGNRPPGSGSQPIDQNTADLSRANNTYDPSNPIRALTNALAAQGINSGSASPVMRTIMAMAPGLASAFLVRGATGGLGNMTAEEVNQQGGIGQFFGDFLRQGIMGQNGGLAGLLQNPMGGGPGSSQGPMAGLRGAAAAVRQLNQDTVGVDMNDPNAVGRLNPFTLALRQLIANDPSGGAGLISGLMTPFLGSYGRAYGDELSRRADLAYGGYNYNDPNGDIFQYLLGVGGR